MKAKSNPPFRPLTHDETAARARELWEREGAPEGRDVEFWLEAERQLRPTPAPSPRASLPPRRGGGSLKGTDGDNLRAKTEELLDNTGEGDVRSPTSLNLGRS